MALQLFKIADVTVATPQTNIEFTSIPSGYTDLKLVISSRSVSTSGKARAIRLEFNGNTTYSNYSQRFLGTNDAGSPTSSSSSSGSGIPFYLYGIPTANATTNTFGNAEVYIPNYTGSNNKSFSADAVAESNHSALDGGTAYNGLVAGLFSQTGAITSIKMYPDNSTNFEANSTATLYGIL